MKKSVLLLLAQSKTSSIGKLTRESVFVWFQSDFYKKKGSKVYPKFNQYLNFPELSWTEPLTQITPPNVMLFRPTFPVNPLHAQLLACLHPVCSCCLTCIFGVNIPTVGMQKLRPKLLWKALKHTFLLLAFLVLFPLSALTCTWNYFVCPLQSGMWFSRVDVGWTAALSQAAVAASFRARPLISVLCGAFLLCWWLLPSAFAF